MVDLVRQVAQLLEDQNARPVLVDVGASGGPPEVWSPIAGCSHYIGFDPDLREIRDEYGGAFARSTMVAQAVTPDSGVESTTFYLTESPFCSSVLEPDLESLDQWAFRRLFDVVRTETVPATTLDRVLDHVDVAGIDWLKLDTQGTDLRIVDSLSATRMQHLIAVDVEPGLIDAYRGEDLFVDAHRALVAAGFWLSRLEVRGSTRASVSTMEALRQRDPMLESRARTAVRISPGWCEARYLRTADSIDWSSDRDPLVLWAFSMLDDQFGSALDIGLAWEQRSGPSDLVRDVLSISVAALQPSAKERFVEVARRRVPVSVRRIIRRVRSRL